MPNALRSAIIVLVALVWAANFTAPLFITDYKPAPELNVAFMAILGVLTATREKEDKKKVDGKKGDRAIETKRETKGDPAEEEEANG